MLLAHGVIRSIITSLEQGPKALNAIRVHPSRLRVLAFAVRYGLVREEQAQLRVGKKLVGIQLRAELHMLDDFRFERLHLHVFNHACLYLSSALNEAEYWRFRECISTLRSFRALVPVLILLLAADIGFVYLDSSEKLLVALLQCLTDTMIHIPSSLLCYSDMRGKLDRANAFLARREEIDGDKPFLESAFGFTENRIGDDLKILLALGAAKTLSVREAVYLSMIAVRAILALCKADFLKVGSACRLVFEVG